MPCEDCDGKGHIWKDGKYIRECEACKQRRIIERLLDRANIPLRFQGVALRDLETKEPFHHQAITYVEEFEKMRAEGKGLTILGPYGVGKTHTAVVLMMEVIRRYQVWSVYLDTKRWFESLWDKMSQDDKETVEVHQKFQSAVRRATLLVMDDIDSVNMSAYVAGQIDGLVNHRYASLLPTILISNCTSLERLAGLIGGNEGGRVGSRLAEINTTIIVTGQDRRKKRGTE